MQIERYHLVSALTGIYRQLGKELPDLDRLSYGSLVVMYAALIEENDLEPFEGNELERLFKRKSVNVS